MNESKRSEYKPSNCTKRLVSLPKELDQEMRKHPEINWSAVAQNAFAQKLTRMKQRRSK